jgi:hypothetical protein
MMRKTVSLRIATVTREMLTMIIITMPFRTRMPPHPPPISTASMRPCDGADEGTMTHQNPCTSSD